MEHPNVAKECLQELLAILTLLPYLGGVHDAGLVVQVRSREGGQMCTWCHGNESRSSLRAWLERRQPIDAAASSCYPPPPQSCDALCLVSGELDDVLAQALCKAVRSYFAPARTEAEQEEVVQAVRRVEGG